MLIYGFVGDKSGFMEMENKLESMQKFVGGLIEVVSLTDEIDLIINEEGLFNGSELRLLVLDKEGKICHIIMGDCFVCCHDKKGNFTSIKQADLSIINKCLLHINSDELRLLATLCLSSMR